MTKPITEQSILERVQEMSRQAQEREAEKLIALNAVKERISAAASEGYTIITIAPDRAVDVTKTATAKATTAALRAEGFSIEWEIRQHPDGRTSQGLVVRW
ncbi:hypothetical protein N5C66_29920 [Rhizobium pusense]|uniref:hypothetical protein n=1 Tax=Agrobacterium pusense TaxID=648995 RepID=UPI00244780E1|nr:hypothetical protein [Agrobacterium pusense]MDH1099339.1 hypothetical protein [Agrobacterium pusense]MDH1115899.1 hypothetical protein [Agrobacterium pusense]MDH2197623.1 hypothetical protein [Agrobacterium pusense]